MAAAKIADYERFIDRLQARTSRKRKRKRAGDQW
jgi:hypothetical protein